MDDLGLIIFVVIVGFLFWGPHNKSAPKKDDKKGEKDEKKGK